MPASNFTQIRSNSMCFYQSILYGVGIKLTGLNLYPYSQVYTALSGRSVCKYLSRSPKLENFSGETAGLSKCFPWDKYNVDTNALGNFRGIMASCWFSSLPAPRRTPGRAKRGRMSMELNTSIVPLPEAPVPSEHPAPTSWSPAEKPTFHKAEPILRVLASNLDYKGDAIGLASAWEMVLHHALLRDVFVPVHSVQICQAEGIPLEQYITLLGEQGKNYEKWLCENIQSGNYQETSAPLELWAGGIQQIAQHAQDSHIDAEFPQARRASLPTGDGCRLWP